VRREAARATTEILGKTLTTRGTGERPSRSVARGKRFVECLGDVRRAALLYGTRTIAMEARQDLARVEAKESLLVGTNLMDVDVVVSGGHEAMYRSRMRFGIRTANLVNSQFRSYSLCCDCVAFLRSNPPSIAGFPRPRRPSAY
jgi:hypothetical protein